MRAVGVALGKHRPAERLPRASLGVLQRRFQRADELLLRLRELLRLQGGGAQLRSDQPQDQRQILFEALAVNFQALDADGE